MLREFNAIYVGMPLDSFKRKINKLSINLTIVNSFEHLTGSSRYEKYNNNKKMNLVG